MNSEEPRFEIVDQEALELFMRDLGIQVQENRVKWEKIHGRRGHQQHLLENWNAIAVEQIGQLAMAVSFGTPDQIRREIKHVAAILFEMHEKITKNRLKKEG